jgi:organic hydroperoxide reductase OsmC/OhrA
MSEHKVTINWVREKDDFSYKGYDRTHEWRFDGGTNIRASGAKEFYGDPAFPNPEEALAASLSSCHMLTFLAIASRKKMIVDSYEDHAVAILDKNSNGKLAVTKTYLHPKVVFSGENIPTKEEIIHIHHLSHEECFIANSVLTEVIVEPVF